MLFQLQNVFIINIIVTVIGVALFFMLNKPQKDFDPEVVSTTFNDVKGINDIKDELNFLVSYLKNPTAVFAKGAKIPHGVLLTGQPGCGKTLLAKAIAGEAHVPFYYASGAEFEEMYVGMGAKRIRALFEKARNSVFIFYYLVTCNYFY